MTRHPLTIARQLELDDRRRERQAAFDELRRQPWIPAPPGSRLELSEDDFRGAPPSRRGEWITEHELAARRGVSLAELRADLETMTLGKFVDGEYLFPTDEVESLLHLADHPPPRGAAELLKLADTHPSADDVPSPALARQRADALLSEFREAGFDILADSASGGEGEPEMDQDGVSEDDDPDSARARSDTLIREMREMGLDLGIEDR